MTTGGIGRLAMSGEKAKNEHTTATEARPVPMRGKGEDGAYLLGQLRDLLTPERGLLVWARSEDAQRRCAGVEPRHEPAPR
jgi:hypothetical protein